MINIYSMTQKRTIARGVSKVARRTRLSCTLSYTAHYRLSARRGVCRGSTVVGFKLRIDYFYHGYF